MSFIKSGEKFNDVVIYALTYNIMIRQIEVTLSLG